MSLYKCKQNSMQITKPHVTLLKHLHCVQIYSLKYFRSVVPSHRFPNSTIYYRFYILITFISSWRSLQLVNAAVQGTWITKAMKVDRQCFTLCSMYCWPFTQSGAYSCIYAPGAVMSCIPINAINTYLIAVFATL